MDKVRRRAVEDRIAELMAAGGGRLTPEAVLEDAQSADSPLHDLFEWDDGKAAHAHRLDQARAVIRSIRVEVETESHTVAVVRYVRDPLAGASQGYIDTLRVRTEVDLAREVMRAEVTRVVAALERAQDIADVLGVGDEVEDLVRRVSDLRRRVAA